jgi:putative serine protease PepD
MPPYSQAGGPVPPYPAGQGPSPHGPAGRPGPAQPPYPSAVPHQQVGAPGGAPIPPPPGTPTAPRQVSALQPAAGDAPTPAAETVAQPRRPRGPIGVTVLIAAGTALVTAVATAFTVTSLTSRAAQTRPASIAQIGQSTTAGVPVEGSSDASPSWEAVAEAVKPSVVAITVTTSQGDAEGSGMILTSDGDVLTNDHVVEGAQDGRVLVTLSDGRMYEALIVGTDPTTDLAVVRITDAPSDLTPVALGDSETVAVGQEVMAVGNPLGLQNTVTTGIVSAVDRPVTTALSDESDPVVTNAIQVDAAVNPGNSGGPLFDGSGRVIGVTSSIAALPSYGSSQSGSIGLGFAIPVNLAKNISSQLVENGTAVHAVMGVRLTDSSATADGVTRRGARVSGLVQGMPADVAGIKKGDVIIAFNGDPTPGADSLTAYARAMQAGDTVTLTLVRDGVALDVDVTLAARQQDTTPTPVPSQTP